MLDDTLRWSIDQQIRYQMGVYDCSDHDAVVWIKLLREG